MRNSGSGIDKFFGEIVKFGNDVIGKGIEKGVEEAAKGIEKGIAKGFGKIGKLF